MTLSLLFKHLCSGNKEPGYSHLQLKHRRLNGSSSHVLTATSRSYGKAKNSTLPHRIETPNLIGIKFGTVDTGHAQWTFWPLTWANATLRPYISLTVQDRHVVTIDHRYETPMRSRTVTWPQKSKSWPHYLRGWISQYLCQIDAWSTFTTYRKPLMGSRMVTWLMTSRDPKRARSWPTFLQGWISQKPCQIDSSSPLTTYRKPNMGSRPMTSRDPKSLKMWPGCISGSVSP